MPTLKEAPPQGADGRFKGSGILTEMEWRQLMSRSIKGESDKDLSQAFGVPGGTIRQRRYSDPVWLAAHEKIREMKALVPVKSTKPIDNVALSLREIGEANPELLARVAHGKILEAIELGTIPQIQSWSEVKTAMEIIRKSCNLDSNTTNVQVNLWSGAPASQAPSVVMDAEIVADKCSDEEWI